MSSHVWYVLLVIQVRSCERWRRDGQGLAFITFDAMGKLFAANPLMAQELGPRVEGTTPKEE